MAAKQKTSYFARLTTGEPAAPRGGRTQTYTEADYIHMNAVPGWARYTTTSAMGRMHDDVLANFMPTRQQRFASRVLFDEWFQKIQAKRARMTATEWAFIEKLKVGVQRDGSIIVYQDANNDNEWQPETERLVARNGVSFRPINAAARMAAGRSEQTVSEYRKSMRGKSTKAMNVHAIITKFVAKAAKKLGLTVRKIKKGKAETVNWGVQEFSAVSSKYYEPIKNDVLQKLIERTGKTFLDRPRAEKGEIHSELERTIKKLVGDPEFKALALAALTGCRFGKVELEAALQGEAQRHEPISGFVEQAVANPIGLMEQTARSFTQFFREDQMLAFIFGGERPGGDDGIVFEPAGGFMVAQPPSMQALVAPGSGGPAQFEPNDDGAL